MSEEGSIYPLSVLPGIKRDGTLLSSRNWTDGQWVRFYKGLPKKMGGYTSLFEVNEIVRGMFIQPTSPNFNVYLGDSSSLKYFTIDQYGDVVSGLVPIDRTPALFLANANNKWQFDSMFSTTNNSSIIIAHAAQNLSSIENEIASPIYYGDANSVDALTPIGLPDGFTASGGIVVLHPFLFIFGNSGDVVYTQANNPNEILGSDRVTAQKIVAGMATRGGNSSPAGLLWSLDSLIRVTQVGTSSIEFSFDTVTSESSILSSSGIVEYDGIYYWAAVDRFLVYNGVVEELPNSMSLEYFFSNLDYSQRQKVWATKITKWGEIWWFFPTLNQAGNECNHAVIYNVREQTWYDTAIKRSAGYFNQTFKSPVWAGNEINDNVDYDIWLHETTSSNRYNIDEEEIAIQSYIESCVISPTTFGPDSQLAKTDKWIELYRVEPDLDQTEDMTLTVKGKRYARSASVDSAPYLISEDTEKIDMREQRRQMTLRFESNVVDGDFYMGMILMVMRLGDSRQ